MTYKYEDNGYGEYIYIDASKKGQLVTSTVRLREGLLIDLDDKGEILGIEIIKK